MKFLRLFFSHSTIILFALSLLPSSGASVVTGAAAAETPIVLAMGPGLPANEQRPAPTQPRYFTINEILAKRDGQTVNTASNRQATEPAALDVSAPSGRQAAQPSPAIPQGTEPFGLITFRAPEGLLWVKWRKLVKELKVESEILSGCDADPVHCENPAAVKFLRLIEESRGLAASAKIDRINRTINAAIQYASDLSQHGIPDLWSPPLATLTSGRGDCEDYAIAKYVALRASGIAAEDLRLLLVHDRVAHQDHAVVSVRHSGRWLMLDNRHEVLIEPKDAWHFTPLFSLDQQGVKLLAAPYGAPPVTAPARVASGPASAAEPASAADLDAAGESVPELRLETFEPPSLRGRL